MAYTTIYNNFRNVEVSERTLKAVGYLQEFEALGDDFLEWLKHEPSKRDEELKDKFDAFISELTDYALNKIELNLLTSEYKVI